MLKKNDLKWLKRRPHQTIEEFPRKNFTNLTVTSLRSNKIVVPKTSTVVRLRGLEWVGSVKNRDSFHEECKKDFHKLKKRLAR